MNIESIKYTDTHTSTPEKYNDEVGDNGNNITPILLQPEVDDLQPANIPRLQIDNERTHNVDLNRSGKNIGIHLGKIVDFEQSDFGDDTDLTPLFHKIPKNLSRFEASTPSIPQTAINKPIQFNFSRPTRNIFNLSPAIKSSETNDNVNDSPPASDKAVKDAFDIFDKSNNSTLYNSSTTRSFKGRKRVKTIEGNLNKNCNNNEKSRITYTKLDNERSFVHTTQSRNMDNIRKMISDPQCIANLTIIMQIVLNAVMVLIFLGISIVGFFAIKRDVDRKIISYMNESLFKINSCKREYFINNCAPEMRAPALEERCNNWESCMTQTPDGVITSMAYFEVLADCINAFFHNISMKSLLGLSFLMLFCIVVPNILFSKFRSSTTINQNYYNRKHMDNQIDNFQQESLVSNTIKSQEKSISNGTSEELGSSSVRFNPNVSYSFYEYDDQESPNQDNSNRDNLNILKGSSSEEDDIDTNDIGNQRILGEF